MNEEAVVFAREGCVLVKNFIPKEIIQLVSSYIENSVNQKQFDIREVVTDQESSLYSRYGDPFVEALLKDKLEIVEAVTDKSLYPTYSYARVYVGTDELLTHTDRPSCEYSVTIHVAHTGNSWPIHMKSPDGKEYSFILNAGDAIIYKGCGLEHWREPMNKIGALINVQMMLHYVDKDGDYSDRKWDKRPKLGLAASARMR